MPVCVVCSGSDFICESGFYFCAECQTQSQDVRQEIHDNDNEEDEGQTLGGKRRRSGKPSDNSPTNSVEENMTSWEGYNFALVGLVDELLSLGANPKLKMVVLKLWSRYLSKMEVAFCSKGSPTLPKLGPNFKKYDANIMYGYAIQSRKMKKVSGDEDCSTNTSEGNIEDSGLQRKQVLKNKRAAFRQTYEKMMHEMSLTSQTLTDVTLEMLAISDINDDEGPKELQFNKDGLKKQQLTGQFHLHPGLLLRNKLLCILYLGLLEVDSRIHLSDLLRWIVEGHLSYGHLSRFFPAEAQLHGENFTTFAAHQPCPSYGILLSATQHVAAYLGLKTLKIPPLKDLIQHYIKELNLPNQVGMLAERLLDLLPMQSESFPVTLRATMPNWEGRAMAHIIIALKLLFGLDDATEHRNSRIARKMNELIISQNVCTKLFVWDDWERFCVLKRTAFMLHLEPYYASSKMATSRIQNVNPFITIWEKKYKADIKKKRLGVVRDTLKRVTSRLKEKDFKQRPRNSKIVFPANLSPYSLYTEIITKAYQDGRIKDDSSEWSLVVNGFCHEMLNERFKGASVDYLTHPNDYVEWAQSHGLRIGLHSGSAVTSINASGGEASNSKADGPFHRVKVYFDLEEQLPSTTLPLPSKCKGTPQGHQYTLHKPLVFPKTVNGRKKIRFPVVEDMKQHAAAGHVVAEHVPVQVKKAIGRPKLVRKSYDVLRKEDEDNMLHTPHTEYWVLHFPIPEVNFSKEAWKLPYSFLTVLEECSSLIQMPPSTLYKEIITVETLHKDLSDSIAMSFKHQKDPLAANRCNTFKKSW